jgi:hypothetical protein
MERRFFRKTSKRNRMGRMFEAIRRRRTLSKKDLRRKAKNELRNGYSLGFNYSSQKTILLSATTSCSLNGLSRKNRPNSSALEMASIWERTSKSSLQGRHNSVRLRGQYSFK